MSLLGLEKVLSSYCNRTPIGTWKISISYVHWIGTWKFRGSAYKFFRDKEKLKKFRKREKGRGGEEERSFRKLSVFRTRNNLKKREN